MNLQFLRYFVTLAQTKNFTRASERMHVVQSSFSAGIKRLEEHLGTPLFYRDKRNVSLTADGEILLPKAHKLLNQWYEIENDFNLRESRVLKVGFVQNLAVETVLPFINRFKDSSPLTRINIKEAKHRELMKELEDAQVHIFFTEDAHLDTTKFVSHIVASEELFFAVNHLHPLAKKDALNLAELHEQPFIERSHCALYEDVYREFKSKKIEPRKVFSAHNNETVAAFIASDLGMTLMPKPIFSMPEIKFIPIKDVKLKRNIIMVSKKDSMDITARSFWNMVMKKR